MREPMTPCGQHLDLYLLYSIANSLSGTPPSRGPATERAYCLGNTPSPSPSWGWKSSSCPHKRQGDSSAWPHAQATPARADELKWTLCHEPVAASSWAPPVSWTMKAVGWRRPPGGLRAATCKGMCPPGGPLSHPQRSSPPHPKASTTWGQVNGTKSVGPSQWGRPPSQRAINPQLE